MKYRVTYSTGTTNDEWLKRYITDLLTSKGSPPTDWTERAFTIETKNKEVVNMLKEGLPSPVSVVAQEQAQKKIEYHVSFTSHSAEVGFRKAMEMFNAAVEYRDGIAVVTREKNGGLMACVKAIAPIFFDEVSVQKKEV